MLVVALAGWYAGAVSPVAAILIALIGAILLFADLAVIPTAAVAIIVVGGIYGGVFTPTEGAAVGVIVMLAIGLMQRKLSRESIVTALCQTAETSGMIFLILFGAEVFGAFLALTRMPTVLAELIGASGLPPYAVLAGMLMIYILLGAVMDELAMILLTLPVFVPIVLALDFAMSPEDVAIWFGILVLVVVGIGLAAPPIGLNVFIISKIANDIPITAAYRGVLPFVCADLIRLVILAAIPALSLWLVHVLN
jgi:C4-dicarboxylate transporter DctM subunit